MPATAGGLKTKPSAQANPWARLAYSALTWWKPALWRAGEQIPKLQAWLEQATVLCEAPLLRALRSMPLPRAAGVRPRLLAGAELEPLRPDGYRTLVRQV